MARAPTIASTNAAHPHDRLPGVQLTRSWSAAELIAFDLETTGTDRFNDVPVSYALVAMEMGTVASVSAGIIDPGREIPAAATAVHGITTERARREGVVMVDAVTTIATALLDASRRGVPIVGMKLDYDLTMLDACFLRETGRRLVGEGCFEGPVVDVLVLDRHFDRYRPGRRTLADLCRHYSVAIEHPHDAVADAIAALEVACAMCSQFAELRNAEPSDLHRCQIEWHKEWAASFSEWCEERGLCPLDECDYEWPIAAGRVVSLAAVRRAIGPRLGKVSS